MESLAVGADGVLLAPHTCVQLRDASGPPYRPLVWHEITNIIHEQRESKRTEALSALAEGRPGVARDGEVLVTFRARWTAA
jgi:hypothetical protein